MLAKVKEWRGMGAAIKAGGPVAGREGDGVELGVGTDGHRPPRHRMYVENSYLELQDTL